MNDIGVSIICNTYNHKNYIADALESFLNQEVDFCFEILVHDDASTDGTTEIVREYEKKYPDMIYPLFQTQNQYSQRIPISTTYQYPRARGKYIAFCEGDDYWNDRKKLQKQYDAMEQNPQVGICAHAAYGVKADNKEVIKIFSAGHHDRLLSVEEVLQGGYIATCSLFFKKSAVYPVPTILKNFSLDYFLRIQCSLEGGMLYLSEIMGCYRLQSEGSWTKTRQNDHEKIVAHIKRVAECLEVVDEVTEYKYHKTIHKLVNKYEVSAAYRQICKVEKKRIIYFWSNLTWSQRLMFVCLLTSRITQTVSEILQKMRNHSSNKKR